MHPFLKRTFSSSHAILLCALALTSAAHAQTVLTGAHDNNANGDGYDAYGPGSYLVPADTGSALDATFNNNRYFGLLTSGTTVGIIGGRFDGNNDSVYTVNSNVTVSGGQFASTFGIVCTGSSQVTVTGGQYNNQIDFASYDTSVLDLYGQFSGLKTGQTQTLPFSSGLSYFTGTLQNSTMSRTFSYVNYATITLHGAAPAPEPSSSIPLILGALGLALLARKARWHRTV